VIEAWDGPLVVGNTPEIRRMHEEYLLEALKEETISSIYSSEFYGLHVSEALDASDRRIDPDRRRIPVPCRSRRGCTSTCPHRECGRRRPAPGDGRR
jgi:hypothetical protein